MRQAALDDYRVAKIIEENYTIKQMRPLCASLNELFRAGYASLGFERETSFTRWNAPYSSKEMQMNMRLALEYMLEEQKKIDQYQRWREQEWQAANR